MQDDLDSEFEEVHELLEEDHEDRRKRSPDASSNRRNNRGRGRGNKGRKLKKLLISVPCFLHLFAVFNVSLNFIDGSGILLDWNLEFYWKNS